MGHYVCRHQDADLGGVTPYGDLHLSVCHRIYLYSLFLVKTKLKGAFGTTLSFGYIAFLFICGTNPFLVSSTGFIVLILMFYIADNYEIISC